MKDIMTFFASFQFDVIVQDAGTTVLHDTATVVVSILDTNDNAPYFSESFYSASISESAGIGDSVTSDVEASDADAGDNGVVRYSLVDGPVGEAVFNIDPESGEITVAKNLDRELVSR